LAGWHDHIFGVHSLESDFYGFVFSRTAVAGSALMLCLTAALPSDGAGVPLCLFKALTGLPCPGCGLTRAFSSLLHGQFARAYAFHPFAFLFVPLAFLLAAQGLLTRKQREALAGWSRRHHAVLRCGYLSLIAGFIGFGALRLVVFAAWGLPPI
jgi:uncharacterized protein DUF2752